MTPRRISGRSRSSTSGRSLGSARLLSTADILVAPALGKDEAPWAKWWEASLAKGETKGPAA